MNRTFLSAAMALLLGALPAAVAEAAPYVKPGQNVKSNEPPPKPEPLVIKFQSAQRQRLSGYDVIVVAGTEALTGKPRQFGVWNREPQDKSKATSKYDPKPEVLSVVEKMKPGEYLKIEPNTMKENSILWVDKCETFSPAEHEEEPGVFIWDGGFKDTVEGTEVFKIELTKFSKRFVCYAAMVPAAEKGKGLMPDPAIIAAAEAVDTKVKASKSKDKPREPVEATISQQGQALFINSLDLYQPQKQGTFTKLAETDVNGQKGQAVDLEHESKTVTALLPGKLMAKRWVTDVSLLAEAKKLKPGAAVLFRTRDVDGKTYLRQLVAAPKDAAKGKETALPGAPKAK